jgi:hypothetical protein
VPRCFCTFTVYTDDWHDTCQSASPNRLRMWGEQYGQECHARRRTLSRRPQLAAARAAGVAVAGDARVVLEDGVEHLIPPDPRGGFTSRERFTYLQALLPNSECLHAPPALPAASMPDRIFQQASRRIQVEGRQFDTHGHDPGESPQALSARQVCSSSRSAGAWLIIVANRARRKLPFYRPIRWQGVRVINLE